MQFNFERTIQASVVLLQAAQGHRMSFMRLLKLLYMADREMLKQTGSPITFDRVVAMKHGPVLSETYNLIKGEHVQAATWNKYIEKQSYHLVSTEEDPGRDKLSRMAVALLNQVSEQYDHLADWDLVNHLHVILPEWNGNWPGEGSNTSVPVSLEDILQALEFEPNDVKEIASELRENRAG